MRSGLKIDISDDEDGEGGTDRPAVAPSNNNGTSDTVTTTTAASPPKSPATPDAPPRQTSIYVAYPRPVVQINGVDTTPLMPSTVGRYNGFLRTYKVLLVGEAGVGKSNLMHRYCYNQYDPSLPSTLGAEFCSREVDIPSGAVGATESVVLQLWDTAGQEQHAGVISNAFYRNAVGAIVVYDVTRRETLLNVPRWVARVMELAREECVCVVVGAKVDLLKSPQGTAAAKAELTALQQEADRISHALDVRNFFTSALSGEGVLEAFTHLVLAVDAVQAAPPEVRADAARYAQHHASHGPAGRGLDASRGSEMWTAASTVPASPVALFGSPTSRHWQEEYGSGVHGASPRNPNGNGTSNNSGSAVSVGQCSPAMTPSPSGYTSPETIGRAAQWRSPSASPSASPRKQKKSLDLRGFGPGEGGSGGGGDPSWGC